MGCEILSRDSPGHNRFAVLSNHDSITELSEVDLMVGTAPTSLVAPQKTSTPKASASKRKTRVRSERNLRSKVKKRRTNPQPSPSETSDGSIERGRAPLGPSTEPPAEPISVQQMIGPTMSVDELQEIVGVLSGAIKNAFDAKSEAFFKAKGNRSWDHQTLLAVNEEAFPDFDFVSAPKEVQVFLEAICFAVLSAHQAMQVIPSNRHKTLNTAEVALAEIPQLDKKAQRVSHPPSVGEQSWSNSSYFTQVFLCVFYGYGRSFWNV